DRSGEARLLRRLAAGRARRARPRGRSLPRLHRRADRRGPARARVEDIGAMMRRAATLVALLAALAILRVAAQTAVLKITSPADGTYVMGPVRLAVTLEPLPALLTI